MAIRIREFTDGDTAVSYEGGKECLKKELETLEQTEEIVLDFEGISYAITAFLNPVIGDLILDKGSDIMKRVQIVNADKVILWKIKMVEEGMLLKRGDICNDVIV